MVARSFARTCSLTVQSVLASRRTISTSSCAIVLRVSSPSSMTAESLVRMAS